MVPKQNGEEEKLNLGIRKIINKTDFEHASKKLGKDIKQQHKLDMNPVGCNFYKSFF